MHVDHLSVCADRNGFAAARLHRHGELRVLADQQRQSLLLHAGKPFQREVQGVGPRRKGTESGRAGRVGDFDGAESRLRTGQSDRHAGKWRPRLIENRGFDGGLIDLGHGGKGEQQKQEDELTRRHYEYLLRATYRPVSLLYPRTIEPAFEPVKKQLAPSGCRFGVTDPRHDWPYNRPSCLS